MRYICQICGYIHEGDQPPKECPVCKQPADKFVKVEEVVSDNPYAGTKTEKNHVGVSKLRTCGCRS